MQIIQFIGDIFHWVFFSPIVNLLVLILHALEAVHIPGALGFSIIILTVIIRLLVWPVMATQLKSAKKMADLKPKLDALKEKHGKDKQAMAAAQMALYKEHGVNPAGGCLPALIQIPVIWALYQTIFAFFSDGQGLHQINSVLYSPSWYINSVPDLNFFGLNLAIKPSTFTQGAYLLLAIPLITALLQFMQSKMMAPKAVKEYPGDTSKEKKEKAGAEDSMSAVQSQMSYMMPLMVGYFALQFPIGLALYWNTFTILGIVQQYLISGWGGLESWIKRFQK
ncbi:MAG: YidC/Oxa1 family membrane protein insertase [Patescibacteria group bacterium]|nr:YidC/Oxa1 family membrane protein insertase [Patescibacteria group bacterium]